MRAMRHHGEAARMIDPPPPMPPRDVLWQRFQSKSTALSATVERVASVRAALRLLTRNGLTDDGAPTGMVVCTAGCAAEYPEFAAALGRTTASAAQDDGAGHGTPA